MSRTHISFKTKLASALLALGHIPYNDAKVMTTDQMLSLYHFDHNKFAAHDGGEHFSNLEPMLIHNHRKKTAKIDIPAIAKSKRIRRKEAAHRGAIALARLGVSPLPQPARHKRKILSRPFAKRHK